MAACCQLCRFSADRGCDGARSGFVARPASLCCSICILSRFEASVGFGNLFGFDRVPFPDLYSNYSLFFVLAKVEGSRWIFTYSTRCSCFVHPRRRLPALL